MPFQADAGALQGRRAGFVSRVLSVGVDFVVTTLTWVAMLGGVWVGTVLVTGDIREFPSPSGWVSAAAVAAIQFTYLTYWWATIGSTLGAQLLGLRVVTNQGQRVPLPRAAARAALCLAFGPIVLTWVLVSRRNAGLHDLLVRTSVVHAWAHPPVTATARPR